MIRYDRVKDLGASNSHVELKWFSLDTGVHSVVLISLYFSDTKKEKQKSCC